MEVFYVVEEFMREKPQPLKAFKTYAEACEWLEENPGGTWSIRTIKKAYL